MEKITRDLREKGMEKGWFGWMVTISNRVMGSGSKQ